MPRIKKTNQIRIRKKDKMFMVVQWIQGGRISTSKSVKLPEMRDEETRSPVAVNRRTVVYTYFIWWECQGLWKGGQTGKSLSQLSTKQMCGKHKNGTKNSVHQSAIHGRSVKGICPACQWTEIGVKGNPHITFVGKHWVWIDLFC